MLSLDVRVFETGSSGDTAGPDEHVVLQRLPFVELDRALVGLGDRVVRREVTDLFEVARELCRDARMQGEGMLSETTYSTDNQPNGAVYVLAEQPGARDIWDELRTGTVPLEPLIDRLTEFEPEPYDIFVLDPVEEPFVVVYLVPEPDSMLASTVRDTYL